ncbi:hypothetical protein HZH66_003249 [Vespula vulgaris]|uniref:Alkaline ceramidase n=1 Tax=Vespula vulgaris TaxID=7454 RepID=A0A834KLH6_VESVU|nr:hypothetical protein HZH66_003249 [Vespula vulgaris]
MWKPFEAGSSPVDWCEGNYSISPSIAEFMNTFSNVVFLLLPPVLMHLFRDYGRFVNPGIHVIWFLLMIVGLSSAYFHATLSLIGQLLDELAILWLYMASFCMFLPRRYIPNVFQNDRKRFSMFLTFPTLIATGLALVHPALNAFALMSLGIPAFGFMIIELKRTTSMRVYRLGLRCGAVWVLAVTSSYTAAVLFAYFSVKEERPQQSPTLRYWPRNDFELGIPYVTIKSYVKIDTNSNI